MKITQLAIALLFGIGFMSCQNSASVEVKTKTDSVSYVFGAFQGERMLQNFTRMKIDSTIDKDLFLKGFFAASEGKELKMDPDSLKDEINNFFRTLQQNQMELARDTTGTVEPFHPAQSTLDSISYLIGADFGKGISEHFEKESLDTVLNMAVLVNGFVTAFNGDELMVETQTNRGLVDEFFKELQDNKLLAEFGHVKKEGEAYLAENRGNSDVVETASGLQYEVLVEGNGEKPTFSSRVKVHYHGTLVDGTVFDSSVDRGEPSTFGVGQVIRGWTEALQLMPVGSKWKLTIPYDIAYGTRPRPGGAIRPFECLIFEVELLEIIK